MGKGHLLRTHQNFKAILRSHCTTKYIFVCFIKLFSILCQKVKLYSSVELKFMFFHREIIIIKKVLCLTLSRLLKLVKVMSDEVPLPGLQTTLCLLCPWMVQRVKRSLMSFYKDTNPTHEASILMI